MLLKDKRDIITNPRKLRKVCDPVKDVDNEGLQIIDHLRDVLRHSKTSAVGLAANQVGIDRKVFIIAIPDISNGHKVIWAEAFINPEIVSLEDPILFTEGCLSFPDQTVETLRYNKVIIKDDLEPAGRSYNGLAAVVVQHENDHVNGITMYQRKVKNIPANDPCLCGSGKKFKKCCLIAAKR